MSVAVHRCVVLLSGGIDSATSLAVARREGFLPHALCLDYGQRHRCEIDSARKLAESGSAAECRVVRVDLRAIGGSALTGEIEVPKSRSESSLSAEVPVTYVPARNMVFLSIAAGFAETIGAADIFIGANAVDYSGYPDCRPEFLRAFERCAGVATKAGLNGRGPRVHAPLLTLTKDEIIGLARRLGVDLAQTHSCYDPDAEGRACAQCDSCVIRRRGFERAGIQDPTRYAGGG